MFFTWLFLFSHSLFAETLVLAPKQSIELPAGDESEVLIEDGSVLRIREKDNKVEVIAKKTGLSGVRIDKKRYPIKVVTQKRKKTHQILRKSLPKSLNVQIQGEEIFISGKLNSISPIVKLQAKTLGLSPFKWRVNSSPQVKNELHTFFKNLIKESGLPPIEFSFYPTFQALISAESKELKASYRKILNPFGVEVAISHSVLSLSPLVEISVLIAEVNKGFLLKYGLQWPSQIQANIVPSFEWAANSPAFFQLNTSESQGNGQVLASPTLLCRSGKKASFHSGGEIPILSGNLGHEVKWKKHGISLEFEPLVDVKKRLNLKIKTEISAPDYSFVVNGTPGFSRNQLQTDFTLSEPRPILISGLIKKSIARSAEGLPLLHRIPILGPLFGSRSFQKNETELIIVVRPKVIYEPE